MLWCNAVNVKCLYISFMYNIHDHQYNSTLSLIFVSWDYQRNDYIHSGFCNYLKHSVVTDEGS